jgi:hypothetical protein
MTSRIVFVIVAGFAMGGGESAYGVDSPAPTPGSRKPTVFYKRDVQPLLSRLGCNSAQCHGSFWGKGGLQLSLFAGDPEEDYATLVKADRGTRIDRLQPAKSALLLKATAAVAHGGGPRIKPDSAEYKTIAAWIEQGAAYWDDRLPSLTAVKVAPLEQVLAKGRTQTVKVTAVFSDGSQQDVTGSARFQSTDAKVVSVDASGKAQADDFGLAYVVAGYQGLAATSRIVVPQPLSSPFPAVAPNNKIDELVFANLQSLGLPPAELCSDSTFLRRVFLDVIGTLPTPEETRAFLADTDPRKRSKLIDRLLDRDEFATYWAMKWADILRIKAEDPVSLWPKGAETYYQWVYESIARNKPFDQFARELLTATGSDFRSGPANFFRAVGKREPRSIGESAALVFLGARLSCAGCHGHPAENWGIADNLGMAACFGQIRYKMTGEWKEEIVYRDPKQELRHPTTGEVIRPKPLGGSVLQVEPGADPRRQFVDWLTAPENPWFAKSLVNRIWCWLLGRGIVHEPDDLRSTNPPENPALLAYLEKELIGHHYDAKHVYRLILNSKTYQLSSVPHSMRAGEEESVAFRSAKGRPFRGAKGDNAAVIDLPVLSNRDVAHFSHYEARRLGAEELIDALSQVTESPRGQFGQYLRRTLSPITSFPNDLRAVEVSDGSAECASVALFGRPSRATGFENERAGDVDAAHVAYLANSSEVTNAVNASPRLQRLLKDKKTDEEILDEIYLAALARFPKESEKQKLGEYLAKNKNNRYGAVHTILWAVLNTNEFLLKM